MTRATIDGNEAAASVAYRLNEVCCIYPIAVVSDGQLADVVKGRPNVWGGVARRRRDAERGRGGGRAARRGA